MNCTDCGGKLYASHSPVYSGRELRAVLIVLECYTCFRTRHAEVELSEFAESYRLYDTHYDLMHNEHPRATRHLGEAERVV